MTIAIYGRTVEKNNFPYIKDLCNKLQNLGADIIVYEEYSRLLIKNFGFDAKHTVFNNASEIKGKVDYFFSIGGDGTLLSGVPLIRDSGIPIIGLNIGRLGFLSSISKDEIDKAITAISEKKFHLDKRTLISTSDKENVFGVNNFGLNEFTLNKLDTSAMIMTEVEVNGEFFSNYWADGLIISTPTGSTAYSLSCGGPVITPECKNFAITPIAPHSLSVRSVIIPDDAVIRLKVKSRSKRFLASLDSNFVNLSTETELEIRKANFSIDLLRLSTLDYMSTLRSKLLWGSDARNSLKFAN